MHFLLVALTLLCCVVANTEVHLIKVPNYYNIPVSVEHRLQSSVSRINDSSLLLLDHPIVSIENPDTKDCRVEIPYDFSLKQKQRLYVKINNYHNISYNANDLLHVKLCWPATTPISFSVDHVFLKNREFFEESSAHHVSFPNQLEIYLVIDMEADFYAVRQVEETSFGAFLVVTRLPNSIPIPLELYDFLVYAMDLLILTVVALPHLHQAFYRTINTGKTPLNDS